jgi:hypothetical protein
MYIGLAGSGFQSTWSAMLSGRYSSSKRLSYLSKKLSNYGVKHSNKLYSQTFLATSCGFVGLISWKVSFKVIIYPLIRIIVNSLF